MIMGGVRRAAADAITETVASRGLLPAAFSCILYGQALRWLRAG